MDHEALRFSQLARQIPGYLTEHRDGLAFDKICELREKRAGGLLLEKYRPLWQALQGLPDIRARHVAYDQDAVCIGRPDELDADQKQRLDAVLKAFIPWKKGPFDIFGTAIDSEWRSDFKWNRIKDFAGPLENKRIADIGCNNGYYMFRMAHFNPELIIGFEPYAKYWYNFHFLSRISGLSRVYFELLGVEHMGLYPKFFDVVFCMGILYHHTDPVGLLQKIRGSLRYGGKVIIDCQGIAGEDPVALVPAGRYAGARGVWFLPTFSCLKNWLARADFKTIIPIFSEPLSKSEQRSTAWAPHESLENFLDPEDPQKTVEGYPAPYRFYVMAR
jgi:tRNA (mo5U34)-methyltransferase